MAPVVVAPWGSRASSSSESGRFLPLAEGPGLLSRVATSFSAGVVEKRQDNGSTDEPSSPIPDPSIATTSDDPTPSSSTPPEPTPTTAATSSSTTTSINDDKVTTETVETNTTAPSPTTTSSPDQGKPDENNNGNGNGGTSKLGNSGGNPASPTPTDKQNPKAQPDSANPTVTTLPISNPSALGSNSNQEGDDIVSIAFSDLVTTGVKTTVTPTIITSAGSTFETLATLTTSGTFTSHVPIATTTISANNINNASGTAKSSSKPVGAIVGGVIGGLIGIAVIGFLLTIWRRRRNHLNAKFDRIEPSNSGSRAASWAERISWRNSDAVEKVEATPSMTQVNPQVPPATFDQFYSYDHPDHNSSPEPFHGGSSSRESIHPDSLTPGGGMNRQYATDDHGNFASQNPVENPFVDQNPFNDPTVPPVAVTTQSTHGHSRSTSSAFTRAPKTSSPLKQSTSVDSTHDPAAVDEFKKVDL